MKNLTLNEKIKLKAHCTNHFKNAPKSSKIHFCEDCEFHEICEVHFKDSTPMMWEEEYV